MLVHKTKRLLVFCRSTSVGSATSYFHKQTEQTKIKQLLQEQNQIRQLLQELYDQGLLCLQKC